MVARWLLHRLGEQFCIVCTSKPQACQGRLEWYALALSAYHQ